MFTTVDEGKGLVKVCWQDIRDRVIVVEPRFAQLVDEIAPGRNIPLYLAYYPYGVLKGDAQSTFLPNCNGGFNRISDPDISSALIKDLGYSKNNAPAGMLLNKTIELFFDLEDHGISIPWMIYKPGAIFPISRILSLNKGRKHMPSGLLKASAGARTVFMLSNIGCATQHVNIQRDLNIKITAPKSHYEHWGVFGEIINSNAINCDWRACILYFSDQWLNKFNNDPAWKSLKLYVHEQAWDNLEYRKNQVYYSLIFSLIQQKRHLKPNPYLADIAQHLFGIAIGGSPGFIPTINEDAIPLNILQKIFINSYGIKYLPTIIQPEYFNFESDNYPIYYSLQNPAMLDFSPKSRKLSSTLVEMRELEHITRIFSTELKKDNLIFSDTVINAAAKNVEFQYFHNEFDSHNIARSTEEIFNKDDRFNYLLTENSNQMQFAKDAKFLRGCVSIKRRG